MQKSRATPVFVIVFLILSLVVQSAIKIDALSYEVTALQPFDTYLPQGASISFQWDTRFVTVQTYSGCLNSSNCNLFFGTQGGRYTFTANETVQLQLIHNVSTLKVNGTTIQSENIVSINPNEHIIIEWHITIAPLWPIVFILGMVGLLGMFAGPYYAVSNFKKKNYREGARVGLIVTVIGIALFIAWLW